MKVQGQFRNEGSFGIKNESEQAMREKERGTSNVVQGMKVQGQFRNEGSFGTSNELEQAMRYKGSFGTRTFFEQGLWGEHKFGFKMRLNLEASEDYFALV